MEIIEKHRKKIEELCEEYDIEFLAVFGSTAREEDTSDSDIDLLVRFSTPVSLYKLVRIERKFSELLNKNVDLVTENSLHSYIAENVRDDMTVIHEQAA